ARGGSPPERRAASPRAAVPRAAGVRGRPRDGRDRLDGTALFELRLVGACAAVRLALLAWARATGVAGRLRVRHVAGVDHPLFGRAERLVRNVVEQIASQVARLHLQLL